MRAVDARGLRWSVHRWYIEARDPEHPAFRDAQIPAGEFRVHVLRGVQTDHGSLEAARCEVPTRCLRLDGPAETTGAETWM